MNKIGSGYWLIYSFGFIFIIGIMYIIFNQILVDNLYPITEQFANVSTHSTEKADRWLGFWAWFPIIALVIILIFLFVKMGNKQGEVG